MQLVPFVVLFNFQNDYYQYFQSKEILSTKVPAYWHSKDNSNRGSKSITLGERIPMVSIIQKNSCNIMRLWDYWTSSISCSHRSVHYVVLWWLFLYDYMLALQQWFSKIFIKVTVIRTKCINSRSVVLPMQINTSQCFSLSPYWSSHLIQRWL